ncbi:GAF and ANTAR domain-containing protein [Amycolatopsis sp. lyj-84]|uniref:GAF and ANTAR domain-containing protein n=1 Tax=Amycolatopsis sp. lyj-84 TaxID=2789284 RepID=UPI003977EC76
MSSPGKLAGDGLGAVLGAIARTLQAEPDVATTLTAIVAAALKQVTGADYAGISLIEHGKIRTVAPTDAVVTRIDEMQYRTGQGPCVNAIAEHEIFRTGDLTAETRWPKFTPAAADTGMRSMLAYRLFVSDTTLGSLNLYSRTVHAFSDQTERDGSVFASHAAIALTGAQTEAGLHIALEHRDTIGMAKGILMQCHGIDSLRAFQMLVETSQASNMKLHQVAAWLVEHHQELWLRGDT